MASLFPDDDSYGSPDSQSSSPPLIYHSQAPPDLKEIGTDVQKTNNDANSHESFSSCFSDLSMTPDVVTISSSESNSSGITSPGTNSCDTKPLKLLSAEGGDCNINDVQLLEISTLVFFDLETTGLARFIGTQNVQITELSFVAISKYDFLNCSEKDLGDLRVVNKLSLCVKPRARVSRAAANITGLCDSNLFRLQPFDEGMGQIVCNFIDRLPKPACLLAHNGNIFDFPLLKAELQRVGMALPPEVQTVDTLSAFRSIGLAKPEPLTKVPTKNTAKHRVSYTLDNIHKHFFKKRPMDSHSAESDCLTLMRVCHKAQENITPWFEKNKKTFSSLKAMW